MLEDFQLYKSRNLYDQIPKNPLLSSSQDQFVINNTLSQLLHYNTSPSQSMQTYQRYTDNLNQQNISLSNAKALGQNQMEYKSPLGVRVNANDLIGFDYNNFFNQIRSNSAQKIHQQAYQDPLSNDVQALQMQNMYMSRLLTQLQNQNSIQNQRVINVNQPIQFQNQSVQQNQNSQNPTSITIRSSGVNSQLMIQNILEQTLQPLKSLDSLKFTKVINDAASQITAELLRKSRQGKENEDQTRLSRNTNHETNYDRTQSNLSGSSKRKLKPEEFIQNLLGKAKTQKQRQNLLIKALLSQVDKNKARSQKSNASQEKIEDLDQATLSIQNDSPYPQRQKSQPRKKESSSQNTGLLGKGLGKSLKLKISRTKQNTPSQPSSRNMRKQIANQILKKAEIIKTPSLESSQHIQIPQNKSLEFLSQSFKKKVSFKEDKDGNSQNQKNQQDNNISRDSLPRISSLALALKEAKLKKQQELEDQQKLQQQQQSTIQQDQIQQQKSIKIEQNVNRLLAQYLSQNAIKTLPQGQKLAISNLNIPTSKQEAQYSSRNKLSARKFQSEKITEDRL
ncbi:UNKNOWN [Stylonychia lemnae]|uniref:Uncharacterized protein n=1 Tax=Stylonychia lemnae TaxID=5949 RepID=A0A078AXI1_STYLE|nr:UNKNOWN [Stylonychia lemnae]|eukprot:CDW87170.1 UNKNOWN [Stylonychia lemnae]